MTDKYLEPNRQLNEYIKLISVFLYNLGFSEGSYFSYLKKNETIQLMGELVEMSKFVNDDIYVIAQLKKYDSHKYFQHTIEIYNAAEIHIKYPCIDDFILTDNYLSPTKVCLDHSYAIVDIDPSNKFKWVDNKKLTRFHELIKFQNIYNNLCGNNDLFAKMVILEKKIDDMNNIMTRLENLISLSHFEQTGKLIVSSNKETLRSNSKTFVLDYPIPMIHPMPNCKVTITFGTSGYKISIHKENMHNESVYVLFKNIKYVSNIETKEIFGILYGIFTVTCSTLEKPSDFFNQVIGMSGKGSENIDLVHKLISDGYESVCIAKDKILGITF
jgi:hypothetical protein